ncbi:MAG TPA: NrfD/PsrC family molybdoenzyme membrane anchor subunit [Herpetosiphonaceae bacterium]
MELGRIVASPHWEWWLVFYFYLGGIAAGAYFMAALIELIGSEEDRELAKVAYYIAFPLVAICGLLLILDLGRPERFWHMLIQSETFWPMFKYWSPMSVGSWALFIFGGLSFLSFLGVLAEDRRFGLGRFSDLARLLHRGPIGLLFELAAAAVGFFIASYTGALLTATNQPFWSDSNLIGALFLASAASTGIATMILLRRRSTARDSLERLETADSLAIGLELVMLAAFLISLGTLALPLIGSPFGLLLLIGTGLFGLILPLVLRFLPRMRAGHNIVIPAALVLIGGFILRYSILMAGQDIMIAGR